MPTPTTLPGAPCWIELLTSDPDARPGVLRRPLRLDVRRTRTPTSAATPTPTCAVARIAGVMDKNADPGMADIPDSWSIYLRVTDADATVKAIEAAGGTMGAGPMAIADLGTMLFCTDPDRGADRRLAGRHPHRLRRRRRARRPVVVRAAHPRPRRRHRLLRGRLRVDDPGRGRHRRVPVLDPGRRRRRAARRGHGRLGLAARRRARPLVGVLRAPTTSTPPSPRSTELGGSIVVPAEDTPYGRLATCADPTGAIFKLRG